MYDRIDGDTPIGDIAEALALREEEVTTAVRSLRHHDLIEEPVMTYETYREQQSGRDAASSPAPASAAEGESGRAGGQNGAASASSTTDTSATLHFPTLWEWLEEETDNVKSYKNTQAFVLMEASEALQSIGVNDLEDLQDLEQCSEPAVVQSLEAAIENNVGGSIPPRCYE